MNESIFITRHIDKITNYLRRNPGAGANSLSNLTSHIWCTSLATAISEINQLREWKITAILSFGCPTPELRAAGFNHQDITLSGDGSIIPILGKCHDWIMSHIIADQQVLLICEDGLSFSGAILLGFYLQRYYEHAGNQSEKSDWLVSNLLKILQFVKSMRPCIEPPLVMIKQLLAVEYRIKQASLRTNNFPVTTPMIAVLVVDGGAESFDPKPK